MKSRLSRAVIASGIAVSVWMTSAAALAGPRQSQDPKQSSKSDQKDKEQKPKQPSTKPLSTNENPDLIGKRNINKGIWGRMAGGTESEVKLGRQLAAQVER